MLSAQLIHHGMDAQMPAALVERATLPTQRTVVGTLQSLPSLAQLHGVRSPALVIIGSVVSLHAVAGACVERRGSRD